MRSIIKKYEKYKSFLQKKYWEIHEAVFLLSGIVDLIGIYDLSLENPLLPKNMTSPRWASPTLIVS